MSDTDVDAAVQEVLGNGGRWFGSSGSFTRVEHARGERAGAKECTGIGIPYRLSIGVHERVFSVGRKNPWQSVVGSPGCPTEDGDVSVAEDHWGWNNVFVLASHEENSRTSEADTHQGLRLVGLCIVNVPA